MSPATAEKWNDVSTRNPTVEFQTAGEYVIGTYQRTETVRAGTPDQFNVHILVLESGTAEVWNGTEQVMALAGMIVGVTGKYIDSAMLQLKTGERVRVLFEGFGTKIGKKNPPKLLKVQRPN